MYVETPSSVVPELDVALVETRTDIPTKLNTSAKPDELGGVCLYINACVDAVFELAVVVS